jgi:hypothetical protein
VLFPPAGYVLRVCCAHAVLPKPAWSIHYWNGALPSCGEDISTRPVNALTRDV